MPHALICSEADLASELGKTVLWREGVERLTAATSDRARVIAVAARPDVVLVDRDLPGAVGLVSALRQEAGTRRASIAVLARGDFEPSEVELLAAGANAVLRLPPGGDWDERLVQLIDVPARRDARFPVSFQVVALLHHGETVGGTALNVSRNGLLLQTRLDALHVGADVELQLDLPPGAPLPAQGRVVRQAGPGQFGLRFLELTGSARQRVEDFVQAAAAA
jgi:CheY-like chemotaxis protein